MFCQDHAVEACWTQINWLLFSAPGFDSCYGLLHDDYCCLCLATWQGRKGRRSPFFVVTFHHWRGDVDTDWPWLLVTPLEGPHPWMWYASNGLKSESGFEHLQVEFACPCSIPLLWFLLLWCPCNGIATTILTDGRYLGRWARPLFGSMNMWTCQNHKLDDSESRETCLTLEVSSTTESGYIMQQTIKCCPIARRNAVLLLVAWRSNLVRDADYLEHFGKRRWIQIMDASTIEASS